jgi:hypothetical protein
MAFRAHQRLPTRQERGQGPAAISEGGPSPAHRRVRKPQVGETGEDGAARLEEPATHEHPQDREEREISADGHVPQHLPQ